MKISFIINVYIWMIKEKKPAFVILNKKFLIVFFKKKVIFIIKIYILHMVHNLELFLIQKI